MEENIFQATNREKRVVWVPTVESMLEDAFLMIALHVIKNQELVQLARSFSRVATSHRLELYDSFDGAQRRELYEMCRQLATFPKIILSVFTGSTRRCAVSRKSYPTDLTDTQWEKMKSCFPEEGIGGRGRKRKHSYRELMNAIMYILVAGCVWRMLPNDLRPWKTTNHYFRIWTKDGTIQNVHDMPRGEVRKNAGRDPKPSAGIIDSQSVKTTVIGGERGYDAGKNVRDLPMKPCQKKQEIFEPQRHEDHKGKTNKFLSLCPSHLCGSVHVPGLLARPALAAESVIFLWTPMATC